MTTASQIFQVTSDACFMQLVFIHRLATFPFNLLKNCFPLCSSSLFSRSLSQLRLPAWHRCGKWIPPLPSVRQKIDKKTQTYKVSNNTLTQKQTHTLLNSWNVCFQMLPFLQGFKAKKTLPTYLKVTHCWPGSSFLSKTTNTQSQACLSLTTKIEWIHFVFSLHFHSFLCATTTYSYALLLFTFCRSC